jgi:hypothetical protein
MYLKEKLVYMRDRPSFFPATRTASEEYGPYGRM